MKSDFRVLYTILVYHICLFSVGEIGKKTGVMYIIVPKNVYTSQLEMA